LIALFNNREDADSAYEWLLKNGYNSSDVHLLMSEETRQNELEQKIREGGILISVRPLSDDDAELIESAWRERGGEPVDY
jgi:hypothetical protein